MRYERKYRIEDGTYDEVMQALELHPASFRRTYRDRWVNTLYLDTPGYLLYNAAISRHSVRLKARIRWYGKDVKRALAPSLEFKSKRSSLRKKEHTYLQEFSLDEHFDLRQYLREQLPQEMLHLAPTVLVRYERSYLLSANGLVRVTVDRNLQYYPFAFEHSLKISPYFDPVTVLEIKYVTEQDAGIDWVTRHLPFRLTRNSKYVQAIQACY